MANEQAGKDFILEVDKDGAGDFEQLAGAQSHGLTQAAEEIDVTNYGSNQNKEILDGAGIQSRALSISGVLKDDDSQTFLQARYDDQALFSARARNANTGGLTWTGNVKVTQLDLTGEHNGSLQFAATLVFSGAVTAV